MQKKEWFDEWFDTAYYHILYQNRDYEEAALFIDNLIQYFQVKPSDKILDLACGKGRHSIYLNQKGFDVEGVDLSEHNIIDASKHSNERLKFAVHDMRDVYRAESFDYIFNLFTSFGYFNNKATNLHVIAAAVASLKGGGKLLIDFLNPYVVINNLVAAESKIIDNIEFNISRSYTKDEYILKKIELTDQGKRFDYYEKVKAIRRQEFLDYFERTNLTVLDVFGDYQLNAYDMEKSDRLIFVVQKQL